jgi:hypothetical protein
MVVNLFKCIFLGVSRISYNLLKVDIFADFQDSSALEKSEVAKATFLKFRKGKTLWNGPEELYTWKTVYMTINQLVSNELWAGDM